MQQEGILRDGGILPEEGINENAKGERRVRSRIRMLLPRLSTVLYTLIAFSFIFVLYRRRDLVQQQVYGRSQDYHSTERKIEHKSHLPSKIEDRIQGEEQVHGVQNDGFMAFGNKNSADGDGVIGNERTLENRTPRFHLLVDVRESTPRLCRTMLSAAVLNYPPPVLVRYGSTKDRRRGVRSSIYGMYDFLSGAEVQVDDLVMIIEAGNLFQLPAEVTLGRFLRHARTTDVKLLGRYGRKSPKIDLRSAVIPFGSQRYSQSVLFGAQKHCSNVQGELACQSTPQSPLLVDLYGPRPDEFPGTTIDVPRYMGPSMAMGRVVDLLSVYRHSKHILETDVKERYDGQQVLARIFGKQEYVRSVRADMFENKAHLPALASVPGNDHNIKLGADYEFGLGLDYMGSIFQVLYNSTADMRFVTFKKPPTVSWASLPSTSAFDNLIQLPEDLLTDYPFKSSAAFASDLSSDLDSVPGEHVAWSEIELLTNVVVPSSSVPAVVSFHGNETLQEDWWQKMWFQPLGRALLRRRMRVSGEGAATKMAPEGAQRWWGFRSGKGGAWTENGTWLEWNELCGSFENEVFGDSRGRFEGV